MDRFKEFLRTKGLYIAIGTGVLAFVGLMVIYNYNTYKSEFGVDKQTVDLNAPEVTETTEQVAETKVEIHGRYVLGEMPETAEANSDEAVAGDTDADNQTAQEIAANEDAQSVDTENSANESAQNTDESTSDSNASSEATAETSSDGVIVNEDGVVVANAYNEGGTLVWPVDGKVILPYSMDTTVYFKTLRSYRCNPGILIAADEGENVLAAYEGVVESVSEDKEHGTTVTVIMGNGFKAIYGQLMNVTVAEGDTITTAQNIGEVAPPSSYYTEEGTHVFFELMKNGVPINPMILMQ